MYRESFASKLAHARKITGFTQREVAKDTKIPQSTIANYETGRTEPDIENLGILADFYGISIDWLVGTAGVGKETNNTTNKTYQQNNSHRPKMIINE